VTHVDVMQVYSVCDVMQVYSVCDVEAADEAWSSYLALNHSPVVYTFQGQFKSTVSGEHLDLFKK